MSIIKEFKEFAMRGNVVDLAVGIIIGTAFNKIVNSLVNDIIMPPIGFILGNMDFADYTITLKEAVDKTPAVQIKYGSFINIVIDFIIVAFAVFMLIKGMNKLKKKQEQAPAAPAPPSNQEVILSEIRDILKAK